MLFGRYVFRCQFLGEARLPVYKGSTFRGVFGHALKAVTCALKRQECATCLLKTQCLYALVFETHLATPPPPGARIASVPHPFVIEPPPTPKREFARGETFEFTLKLFGEVNNHLPYFIYAFDRMGQLGVGKRVKGRRASFTLRSVAHNDHTIYTHKDKTLRIHGEIPQQTLAPPPEDADKITKLKIELITPLRLKFRNNFTAELPFHILTRAMLRRISTLMTFYNGGEPPLDYRGLTRKAEVVEAAASNLGWYAWKRFSQRQHQKMPFGGMIGTVTYEGALGEFIPLVKFCEKTHIGKQTAFGLGEIAMVK